MPDARIERMRSRAMGGRDTVVVPVGDLLWLIQRAEGAEPPKVVMAPPPTFEESAERRSLLAQLAQAQAHEAEAHAVLDALKAPRMIEGDVGIERLYSVAGRIQRLKS